METWHEYPNERPFAFPGKTPFFVTVKNKSGAIYTDIALWDHFTETFDADGVIAWMRITKPTAFTKE